MARPSPTALVSLVKAPPPWASYGIVVKNRSLFAEAFSKLPRDQLGKAIRAMLLLGKHGFPAPAGMIDYEAADSKNPRIWRLKLGKNCIRLYFWADPPTGRLVYLHALCKKRQKRDESDSVLARDRLERYLGDKASVERLELDA